MKHTIRFAAALAAAGLILAGLFAVPALAVTRSELEQSVSSAQSSYQNAEQELEEQRLQEQQAQQQVDSLEGQAASVQAQLREVYARLEEARAQLAQAQNEAAQAAEALDAAQAAYNARYEACKSQLQAMQQLNDGGGFALLSSAGSLYELLTFTEVLGEMTVKNEEILAGLDAEAAALAAQKQDAEEAAACAEEARQALESQQAQLDGAQAQLAEALAEANELLDGAEAERLAAEALTEEARRAYEKAQAELDAYVKAQSALYTTPSLHCSLQFGQVISGYSRISTHWGDRDPWGYAHWATDFAAPGGTPIYAAADGVVSTAASHSSYGNYVVISHGTADDGRTYDTLYAHMSSYTVRVGASISKGELIGYVGNTGQVSGSGGGYHLHLELRINGNRAVSDPLAYIPR